MSETHQLIEDVQDLVEMAKLGSGGRFKALTKKIAAAGRKPGRKKPYNVKAIAAAIGRKKYGAKKMAKMAAAGKKG